MYSHSVGERMRLTTVFFLILFILAVLWGLSRNTEELLYEDDESCNGEWMYDDGASCDE